MNKEKQKNIKQKLLELKRKLIFNLDKEINESTELSYLDNHPADTSDEDFEKLKDLVMKNENKKQIEEIDNALTKIEAGSYGVCEMCGKSIVEKRLEIVPTTRYCKNCAEQLTRLQEGFDPKIRPIRENLESNDNRGDFWDQVKIYGSSGEIIEGDRSEYKTEADDGREEGIVEDIERESKDD